MPNDSSVPFAHSPAAADLALSVVLRLYEAIDSGRATEAIPLFTEDAVLEHPDHALEGAEEISAFLTRREADTERHTVHLFTNVLTRQLDDGDIEVRGVMMIHMPDATGAWQMMRLLRVRHLLRLVDAEFLIGARLREPLEQPVADGAS